MKFIYCVFFENLQRKFEFHLNLTRMPATLNKNTHIFVIISLSDLLRMRNVSKQNYRENQNTHFMFSNFFSIIVPFMRYYGEKNILEPGRVQVTIGSTRIAVWITKAANTNSEY